MTGKRPLLIGLDGEAEPVPAGELRGERQRLDEVEREFEAVGFFGVDREADAGLPGMATRARGGAANNSLQHPIALRHLVARMEGRELDRDARRLGNVPVRGRPADRRDRVVIGGVVARGVGRGARRLAEHVVGMPIALALGFAGALDRLLDRAADDELAAEDAHRCGHRLAHHRLAGAGDEAAQRAAQDRAPPVRRAAGGRSASEPRSRR